MSIEPEELVAQLPIEVQTLAARLGLDWNHPTGKVLKAGLLPYWEKGSPVWCYTFGFQGGRDAAITFSVTPQRLPNMGTYFSFQKRSFYYELIPAGRGPRVLPRTVPSYHASSVQWHRQDLQQRQRRTGSQAQTLAVAIRVMQALERLVQNPRLQTQEQIAAEIAFLFDGTRPLRTGTAV